MTDTEGNKMSVYTLYNTLFRYKQAAIFQCWSIFYLMVKKKKKKSFCFFLKERYLILEQTTIRSVCLRTTFAHAGM